MGREVERWSLQTAGAPAQLRLTTGRATLRADGQDLAFVSVEVLDKNGVLCPNAADQIRFSLSGPGTIAAVGNGNPATDESFQKPTRKAFQGRCEVILKSKMQPGTLYLQASARGLQAAAIMVTIAKNPGYP